MGKSDRVSILSFHLFLTLFTLSLFPSLSFSQGGGTPAGLSNEQRQGIERAIEKIQPKYKDAKSDADKRKIKDGLQALILKKYSTIDQDAQAMEEVIELLNQHLVQLPSEECPDSDSDSDSDSNIDQFSSQEFDLPIFMSLIKANGGLGPKPISYFLTTNGLINKKFVVKKIAKPLGSTVEEIYKVFSLSPRKLVYVIKRHKVDQHTLKICQGEIDQLDALNQSDIVNIDRLKKKNRFKKNRGKINSQLRADYPHFALKEASLQYGPTDCFIVLHGAQGQMLAEIFKDIEQNKVSKISEEEASDLVSNLGRTIGALHVANSTNMSDPYEEMTTAIHHDLHGGNIFFNKAKKKFTFIDNQNLHLESSSYGEINEDIKKVLGQGIVGMLIPKFQRIKEIQTQIKQMKLSQQKPSQELIGELDQHKLHVQKVFRLIKSFINGYLVHFPVSKQEEIREFLMNSYYNNLEKKYQALFK